MPVQACSMNGKPGLRWGKHGHCYPYNPKVPGSRDRAHKKAVRQSIAVRTAGYTGDAVDIGVKTNLLAAKRQVLLRRFVHRRPPVMLSPVGIEKSYQRRLLDTVDLWEKEYLHIVEPYLDRFELDVKANRPTADDSRQDGWSQEFARLMDTLEVNMYREIPKATAVSLDIAQDTTNWNDKQWKKTVRSMVGVDIYTREPWLNDTVDAFAKENASLIRKLADETREDIEGIVSRGFRQGKSAATLKKEILNGTDLEPGRFRKTRTRAKLIARDQVNKLNGQLTEMRQTELGITQYIWRTSVDERVRESHKVMEGKTCRWDNSAVYKSGGKWISRSSIGGVELHPGQDYQCRCYAEADFSTLLGEEKPKPRTRRR